MPATTGITFAVSEVERATRPLPEVPYKRAVENLLTAPPRWQGSLIGLAHALLRRLRPTTIEACSRYHGRLVSGVFNHPVIEALRLAYTGHRPVSLSPDMLWLMICQAAAHHVNAHAGELRPRLVAHEGRTDLAVRRDDFFKGSPENPWAEVVADLSAQVREHVGPPLDLFVPNFSTTGPTERAAAGVVLLDAVRSYFHYEVMSVCGIPAVTLEGTAEDWEALAGWAQGFADLGLGRWLEVLTPLLGKIAASARGDVDVEFWKSMYRYRELCGVGGADGWIVAFFPYLKGPDGNASRPYEALLDGTASGAYGVGDRYLPGGLACAPFTWHYRGQEFDMEFLGGFVGVAQDPKTLCLRPEIGWAVRERGHGTP